jgi:hypothetical protein
MLSARACLAYWAQQTGDLAGAWTSTPNYWPYASEYPAQNTRIP